MNRLLDGIKDRTTREKIAQALTATKPASLLAATQIVEAQTPAALADDETEPLAADTELPESLWPAESSLDEPTLEQEYHDSHARHFERRAEKRFRQLLKVRIQPRWKFIGVPSAEREYLREQIDELNGWLKAARADLGAA